MVQKWEDLLKLVEVTMTRCGILGHGKSHILDSSPRSFWTAMRKKET